MLQKPDEKRNEDARISKVRANNNETVQLRRETQGNCDGVGDGIGIIKNVDNDNKRAGPRYRKSGAGGVILSSRRLRSSFKYPWLPPSRGM